jgi:hypothetical protein
MQLKRRLEETERSMERIVAQLGAVTNRLTPHLLAMASQADHQHHHHVRRRKSDRGKNPRNYGGGGGANKRCATKKKLKKVFGGGCVFAWWLGWG